MAATLIFFAVTAALVVVWNALFRPVPWRVVAGIWLAIALYQGETLFTRKVDVPTRLAYWTYPWKALGRAGVSANTGIAFQQIVPWTETAREILKSGEAPLWNRRIGSGTPLLSDQQTSIAHPFTLLGLYLPIGKAWTLSVALRLFFALFFFFIFLRSWELHGVAAFFGAIAYGFSTFHIVTLVMPLGLGVMSLPMALATTDELMRRPRARAFVFVTAALAMTVLSGHPEAELWVGLTAGAYALYMAAAFRNARPLLLAATAALSAILLTAFFWYPTTAVLKMSNRYRLMTALLENPPEHHLGAPWFMVLVSPNILGTVPGNSYRPPEPRSPDLLDDYGETACGYTGIATYVLAVAALPLVWRRKPGMFALAVIVIASLMIMEAPGWHALVKQTPLLNVSLLQRFRLLWNLGMVILAAIGIDAWIRGAVSLRRIVIACAIVAIALAVVLIAGLPPLLPRVSRFELVQIFFPAALLLVIPFLPRRWAFALVVFAFADLGLTTWRYNPPSAPEDVFPTTGAIETMRRGDGQPYRIVARGYAFLPDTPGYYGLEDVKSTSPFSTPEYLRFFTGYFATEGFDQVVGATRYGFNDFLNVRYIYVPPGETPAREDVVEIYRGADGAVFRNDKALPRYFFPKGFDVELSFGMTVARMKDEIQDYRERAFVDHLPDRVRHLAGQSSNENAGGEIEVAHYGPNSVDLAVESRGWNLLVSSDEWWPGWRAYWNGRRTPHVRVNGAFVGMFVPPGKGIARFRYRPKEFDHGVAAATTAAILIIVALGIHGFRKRRNTSPAESASAA